MRPSLICCGAREERNSYVGFFTGRGNKHGGSRPTHILSTLNPKLLKFKDGLDLSWKKSISIRFPDSNGPGARLWYSQSGQDGVPFPPDSSGFLYYNSEAPAGALERSLRFRLTSNNTPSSFSGGQDLLAPSGLPWRVTLPQIACYDLYPRIREQLLHENLATEEQLSQCRNIFR